MVAGLGTPLACAMVSGVMASAISKVHYKNGFWAANKGFEPNLMFMASAFAIAGSGGGALSLDGLRGKRRQGLSWALAQLVAGAGTAVAVLKFSSRQAQPTAGAPSTDGLGHDLGDGTGPSEQGQAKEQSGAGA
jgi:putative oxidoreductase